MKPLTTKASNTDHLIRQLHVMEYKNVSTLAMYHHILQHHGNVIITRIMDEFDSLLSRSTYYFFKMQRKLTYQSLSLLDDEMALTKTYARNQFHFFCKRHITHMIKERVNGHILNYLIHSLSEQPICPSYRRLHSLLNTTTILCRLSDSVHYPVSQVTEQQVRSILKCFRSHQTDNTTAKEMFFRNHPGQKYNDLVNRQFIQEKPNMAWCSDTLQVKVGGMTYYVCIIIDLYDHIILSHSISMKEDGNLAIAALDKIIKNRKCYKLDLKEQQPIFHSDNGTLFNCNAFVDFCKKYHIKQSRSRPGTPNDNGVIEGVNSLLKSILSHTPIPVTSYDSLQAHLDLFEHFYNNRIQKMCIVKEMTNGLTGIKIYTYDSPLSHREKYYRYHNEPNSYLDSQRVTNYNGHYCTYLTCSEYKQIHCEHNTPSISDDDLAQLIFTYQKQDYFNCGYQRMSAILSIKENLYCNPNKIKQIMRKYGLESQHRSVTYNVAICNFLKSTNCNHIIHEHTLPTTYNEQWSVQILPFKLNTSTHYLLYWTDLYNRQVVAFTIIKHIKSLRAYTIRREYKRLCKKLKLAELPIVLPPDCNFLYSNTQNYTHNTRLYYMYDLVNEIKNSVDIRNLAELERELTKKLRILHEY